MEGESNYSISCFFSKISCSAAFMWSNIKESLLINCFDKVGKLEMTGFYFVCLVLQITVALIWCGIADDDPEVQSKAFALCSDLTLWPRNQQQDSPALIARQLGHRRLAILDVFPIYLENKWKWRISFHFHNAAHGKWQISAHLW